MDEVLRVIVRRSGGSWVAEVPSLQGCEAHAATRERCLAQLLQSARRTLGSEVALLEEDPPVLVGVSEVATMLGWDRRKVAVYAERGHLPGPVAELAGGRVWRRADIEAFKAGIGAGGGGRARARPGARGVRA